MTGRAPLEGVEVAFLSWRDTHNPEGGGAERALEEVAEGLVERGAQVTVFSAAHAGAPPEDEIRGVRYVRNGSKLTVYPRGMQALRRGDLGHPDVVVDVQNGLPFFTRLVTRSPVIVLVHHVHREQWPVVYPGMMGKVGWWIERRFAPRLYRRSQYVTGSQATRDELVAARRGQEADRGRPLRHRPATGRSKAGKTDHPSVCVVGRLVPHKQVEHAIDAVVELRKEIPGLTLTVVGSGWWEHVLKEYAAVHDPDGAVRFLGQVDEHEQGAGLRGVVGARPPVAEGGLGSRRGRGGPGRDADGRLRQCGWDARVGAARPDRAAGRRPGRVRGRAPAAADRRRAADPAR